jgi:t-SNARE complex subunit (syntaxin)
MIKNQLVKLEKKLNELIYLIFLMNGLFTEQITKLEWFNEWPIDNVELDKKNKVINVVTDENINDIKKKWYSYFFILLFFIIVFAVILLTSFILLLISDNFLILCCMFIIVYNMFILYFGYKIREYKIQ